jgi:hypothetical protein
MPIFLFIDGENLIEKIEWICDEQNREKIAIKMNAAINLFLT